MVVSLTPGQNTLINSNPLPPLPSIPLPSVKVGARLQHFVEAWSNITDNAWALSIISKGYCIPFVQTPPLSRSPIFYPLRDNSHLQLLKAEVQNLLEKEAIERVLDHSSPGFYSRLFLVPKKNGKVRPVIDLSPLNKMIQVDHFQMETTASVRKAIEPGSWAVSIDLMDAYLHIPIQRASRKFLRFTVDGEVFQFRSLPFGISTAPLVFTNLMEIVAAYIRRQGPRLIQYFDYWLNHRRSREELMIDLNIAWRSIIQLGLIPNTEKSELVPSQDFVYIGMNFRTDLGIVRVPEDRVNSILCLLFRLYVKTAITARKYLSLLGTLNSTADLVDLGRLHMRPLQFHLLSKWKPHVDSLEQDIHLGPQFSYHLKWWMNPNIYTKGVPLQEPKPDFHIFTDASHVGWGAHIEPLGLLKQGLWCKEDKELHINNLEMKAVFLALHHWSLQINGCCVMIASDNTTVVSYLKRQGGPIRHPCAWKCGKSLHGVRPGKSY